MSINRVLAPWHVRSSRNEHSPDGAPCVRVSFGSFDGASVGYERIVHLAYTGVAATQQVQRLTRPLIGVDRLAQILYGKTFPLILIAETVNTMIHPSCKSKHKSTMKIVAKIHKKPVPT